MTFDFLPAELRSFPCFEMRRFDCRAYDYRRRWTSRVKPDNAIDWVADCERSQKHAYAQRDERHRKQATNWKLHIEQSMQQEQRADDDERDSPGKGISIEPPSNQVLFRFGLSPARMSWSRTTGVDSGEEPGAKHTKDEERHTL